jgi:hypothetical protein
MIFLKIKKSYLSSDLQELEKLHLVLLWEAINYNQLLNRVKLTMLLKIF